MVRINNHETPVLQDLASRVPENGLIFEIGAAFGYSATKMADASHSSVKIITVDPWTLAPQKQQPERERIFLEAVRAYSDRILPVKSFSQDVDLAALLAGREIDLLFIDGDHNYHGVSHDYLKFGDSVKSGGLLVFHDYVNERWPGVARTVDELVVPSGKWVDYYDTHRFWVGTRR